MACGFCREDGHTDRNKGCPRRDKPPRVITKNTDGPTHHNINKNKILESVSKLIQGKKEFVIGVTSNLQRLKMAPEINGHYTEIRTMWASYSQASIAQRWAEVLLHVASKKDGKNLRSTYPSDIDSDENKPRLFLYLAFR